MKSLRGSMLVLAGALIALGGCAGDGRTVLTVYSPHGRDLLEHMEKEFERAHPEIDVQWLDVGSQEVLERIRAERVNPQADVWFGAPAEAFERAAREGLLEPFTPSWAGAISSDARDPEDRWFGTYLTPEVIAYNAEALTREEAPQDWDDVLDPKWEGKVLIRDPIASGTMRAIFGLMIQRSIERTGSPEEGYAWLRQLDVNTREYTLNPTILYQKLARREGLITLWNMPDIATLKQRRGLPIDYIIPSSGTPLLVDGIAIVANAKQPAAARLYYEFVTSTELLVDAAERFLRIPARTDIPEESLPQWIRDANAEIRPVRLDRQLMSARLDEWMTYWDSHIRGSGRRR